MFFADLAFRERVARVAPSAAARGLAPELPDKNFRTCAGTPDARQHLPVRARRNAEAVHDDSRDRVSDQLGRDRGVASSQRLPGTEHNDPVLIDREAGDSAVREPD
ncbi:hypothetical protein AB0B25_28865 [Nocardia sp. NPDC049190]|uniref:hypothetical protein n=1 Tax=Nocardia sp. NPDC049190 TaxID=3155650 RepID=UPI0033C73577